MNQTEIEIFIFSLFLTPVDYLALCLGCVHSTLEITLSDEILGGHGMLLQYQRQRWNQTINGSSLRRDPVFLIQLSMLSSN